MLNRFSTEMASQLLYPANVLRLAGSTDGEIVADDLWQRSKLIGTTADVWTLL